MSGTAPEPLVRAGVLTPDRAEALAGLLDIDNPATTELPPLWHWVYLVEQPRQRDLGPDGHPHGGIPAPPGPGWRRMFAGGRVAASAALRLDEVAQRATRLLTTERKVGRSGELLFATVRSVWEQQGRVVIVDEQDIVYRPPEPTPAPPPPPPAAPADEAGAPPAAASLDVVVDPVVLFRFSALTYNAHRIHYDAAYAAAEGYPGLVVHGPLQALLLGEYLRRSGAPVLGSRFAYRLVAPTFAPGRLSVTSEGDGHAARVRDGNGRVTATARLEPLAENPS
jgi:3-methylfumaryl-CoA hydratase